MDVMMFWVNQELLDQAGLNELKDINDFYILKKSLQGQDKFAYGDAWEDTHVYNSIAQFANFWGGDYFDWSNQKTRQAVQYMKSMLENGITSQHSWWISMDKWKRNLSEEIRMHFYVHRFFEHVP